MRLKRPTRTRLGQRLRHSAKPNARRVPLRSCFGWGLPGTMSPAFLVVSYTTVPPLPVRSEARGWKPENGESRSLSLPLQLPISNLRTPSAVHFCGTILQLALTGRYPASRPAKPGLSSREPEVGPGRKREAKRFGNFSPPSRSPLPAYPPPARRRLSCKLSDIPASITDTTPKFQSKNAPCEGNYPNRNGSVSTREASTLVPA